MPKPTPASPAEPELDFEHHLPAGMESFTVRFLAAWFNTSAQHWINLIYQGAIKAADLRGPAASKSMLRVPRAELIRYLNSRT
jgi:hypothetical protein